MIPTQFAQNIISIYGAQGKTWLENLPDLLEYCAQKWQLQNLRVMPNLSFHYVASAFSLKINKPIALKIRIDHRNFMAEKNTLAYYDGSGCAALYDWDETVHALLLEQCIPGIPLASFDGLEDGSIFIAAHIIRLLQSKKITAYNSQHFPRLSDWLNIFKSPIINKLPTHHHQRLISCLQLNEVQDAITDFLLHGDLHQGNILLNGDKWVAIDPKGVIGNPAFEVASFICNPISEILTQSNPREIVANRIHLFSQALAIDKQEIKVWSYIRALLGACWALEDNTDHHPWLKIAEIIESI